MEVTVKSKYLKSAAQKVRPVLWGIRGKNPAEVLAKVSFTNKKGASYVREILKSALAAAKENDLETEKLMVKSIYVSEGPRLKRRQIGSRGRSNAILKRMCHLTLTISDEIVKIEKDAKVSEEKAETIKKEKKDTK